MKYVSKKRNKKIIYITILLIMLWIILWYMYNTYNKIEINQNSYQTTRLQSTNYSENVENITNKSNTLADKIEDVTKSVVGISKLKNTGSSILDNNSEEKLGLGTGIIVSSNGYILSNQHLTGEKYSKCYVTLEDGKTYGASVVWSDIDLDLSILKINEKDLVAATLGDSSQIRVGESVYAIGNPIGFEFRRTVTSGIISAKNRTIKLEENGESSYMTNLIQTDATINPGNSGGPLVNINGEVIGITSMKLVENQIEGMGFTIPIELVMSCTDTLEKGEKIERPYLGVETSSIDNRFYLRRYNINIPDEVTFGAVIVNVVSNSPASNAGLKSGDVIVTIDDVEITDSTYLKYNLYKHKIGDKVKVKYYRDGKINETVVTLSKLDS